MNSTLAIALLAVAALAALKGPGKAPRWFNRNFRRAMGWPPQNS